MRGGIKKTGFVSVYTLFPAFMPPLLKVRCGVFPSLTSHHPSFPNLLSQHFVLLLLLPPAAGASERRLLLAALHTVLRLLLPFNFLFLLLLWVGWRKEGGRIAFSPSRDVIRIEDPGLPPLLPPSLFPPHFFLRQEGTLDRKKVSAKEEKEEGKGEVG